MHLDQNCLKSKLLENIFVQYIFRVVSILNIPISAFPCRINFRHSLTVQFPNSLDFRNVLGQNVSEICTFCLDYRHLSAMPEISTSLFKFQTPFMSVNLTQKYLDFRCSDFGYYNYSGCPKTEKNGPNCLKTKLWF